MESFYITQRKHKGDHLELLDKMLMESVKSSVLGDNKLILHSVRERLN